MHQHYVHCPCILIVHNIFRCNHVKSFSYFLRAITTAAGTSGRDETEAHCLSWTHHLPSCRSTPSSTLPLIRVRQKTTDRKVCPTRNLRYYVNVFINMEEELSVRIVAAFCLALVGSSRCRGGQGKRGSAVCLSVCRQQKQRSCL